MLTWREGEARNEARFRDQNEWIEATSAIFSGNSQMTFVCECGDIGCTETIELSKAEYESVRSESNRFAVVPNHENPESEAIVRECSRFAVIDKIEGWGLRIARDSDCRTGSSRTARKSE